MWVYIGIAWRVRWKACGCVSDTEGLGWGLRICISSAFPVDASADAGPRLAL